MNATIKPPRAKYKVKGSFNFGERELPAKIVGGGLAIHARFKKDKTSKAWALTHESSGKRIASGDNYLSVLMARETLLELLDWQGTESEVRAAVAATPAMTAAVSKAIAGARS